jgi:hypothetical protein
MKDCALVSGEKLALRHFFLAERLVAVVSQPTFPRLT